MATMTRADRDELRRTLNGRKKVAQKLVEARKAEQIAELEAQLSKVYSPKELGLEQEVAEAEALAHKIDMQLAQKWKALMREKPLLASIFDGTERPSCGFSWLGRGMTALAQRRAELRKAGIARIEEMARAAHLAIEHSIQEGHEMLVRDALESSAAVAFLEKMPAPEQLMPIIDITTLKPAKLTSDERFRITGIY